MRPAFSGRKAGRGGFSIVEATIAIALLSLGCVSLVSGLTFITSDVQFEREQLRATQIMIEKLETVRLYSWERMTTSGYLAETFEEPFYPANQYPNTGATNSAGIIFKGSVQISSPPISESYADRVRLVTVTVQWNGARPNQRQSMSTLVAQDGMQIHRP